MARCGPFGSVVRTGSWVLEAGGAAEEQLGGRSRCARRLDVHKSRRGRISTGVRGGPGRWRATLITRLHGSRWTGAPKLRAKCPGLLALFCVSGRKPMPAPARAQPQPRSHSPPALCSTAHRHPFGVAASQSVVAHLARRPTRSQSGCRTGRRSAPAKSTMEPTAYLASATAGCSCCRFR